MENIKAQMKKGVLELCVLSVLQKEEKYPSEILEILKEKKLIVVEGTIYPLLSRLKNDKLLEYKWRESNSGPPRKYFTITEKGKKYYEELCIAWEELDKSISQLISKKQNKTK